jgi:pentapeptide MXKDX repeat protein
MTRLMLTLSAATLCLGVALAPAAFAQGMTKEGSAMSPTTDKMTKPDAKGKTDAMGKAEDKKDGMKKSDGMAGKKDDAMSGGMKK